MLSNRIGKIEPERTNARGSRAIERLAGESFSTLNALATRKERAQAQRKISKKREGRMKRHVIAIALLIGSTAAASSAEKVLNFKLITIFIGEKDGERHLMGVTVSPDGKLGTKDFFDKPGANDSSTGRSTYYFDNGSIEATYKDSCPAGHCKGEYVILSGTGDYKGATGTGTFDGLVGPASPLKNAGLLNIQLNVKIPGS